MSDRLFSNREMNHKKPVILTFLRYYLPGYKSGGPVRTIANMVESLGDEFEFRIITTDRDILDTEPYPEISTSAWNRVGKAWVYYVSSEKASLREWMKLIGETSHDVVYFNSLLDPSYTLLPLLVEKLQSKPDKPVVVAPRGELSPGAIAIKRWKKLPFLIFARAAGLYRSVLWHASTEEEASLIQQAMGSPCETIVARNVSATLSASDFTSDRRSRASTKPLRIVFLSRIAKMKNLDFALRVLTKIDTEIQFDIWGTQEDVGYWEICQNHIRSMPKNIDVRYRGVADHADVIGLLAGYDLFFLPTRGENYGHVIAEAVSAGTPLLISDQTPWRDLSERGVGWDLPLDDESAFVRAIKKTRDKTSVERDVWRGRVYDYAKSQLCDPSIVEANRQVFIRAIGLQAGIN